LPAASGNAHLITKVSEKELLGTEDASKSDGLVLSEEAAVGYGPDQEIGPRLNVFQVVVSVMLTIAPRSSSRPAGPRLPLEV
jgi:hypothetical protein